MAPASATAGAESQSQPQWPFAWKCVLVSQAPKLTYSYLEQVVWICCLKMSKLCVANLYYQTIRCFSSNLAAGWEGRNMFALGTSPVWSTPDLSQSGADIKQTRSENTE